MKLDLTNIVTELQREKKISSDLIMKTVEFALSKAYEKTYGTTENLVIRHDDDLVLSIFSKKSVVKNVTDDLFEISVEKAKEINEAAEEGDEMLIPCNPEEFGRIAIHTAKQIILQRLREMKKDSIYTDYKAKEGELIIGYVQRIKGDVMYVNLGNYEGILPKKNQAPHEVYKPGDRIKSLIEEVKKSSHGNVTVILSRTSPDFIKKLLEVEIPEIYDKIVEIRKIAREPGYKTKIAVYSEREEIDPVGACVGQKGARIANIIKELEGEKIDVVKYSNDPRIFIAYALTPAKVNQVIISNEKEKKAIAIVEEDQLSYAIGKKGLNIKLANMLTEWEIDVKTVEQALELKLITDHVQVAHQLFKEEVNLNEIDTLDLDPEIKEILKNNSIKTIEEIIDLYPDKIKNLNGMSDELAEKLKKYIDENFEVVYEEEETEEPRESKEEVLIYYECPECGHRISEDDKVCPNCGVEFVDEEE